MFGLDSVASKFVITKLVFLSHPLNEPITAPAFRNVFGCRAESFFDASV